MRSRSFKLATFNVNSVRTRLELVTSWLVEHKPDVLCLQEIKVQDHEFPLEAFQAVGYNVEFRGQKTYAGVAIVSKEPATDVSSGLDDGGERDDARLIRAVVAGVPIVNTYIPQGQSLDSPYYTYKLEWLARLRKWFERHYAPDQPLLWVGDFNVAPEPIDVHNPRALAKHVAFHPDVRAALQRVKDWGFVDVVRQLHPEERLYTFWDYRLKDAIDRNIGWRVDHIWATGPLAAKCVKTWIDVDVRRSARPSDHTFLVGEFAL